ncbi:MAG TPA: SDR family NAD(P)-dependent oxidoreductase, partial [Acidimicrobiales bacterium]|nr:SDR family NAD(P)-dependent oxidoreductase [Acidimicrobiales bacterium]
MRRRQIALPGALVLVTGAGSGIGQATAHAFANRGATVLCADIDSAAAERTAEACARSGPEPSERPEQPEQPEQAERTAAVSGRAYAVDVADQDAVTEMAARVADEHGPLDVLVNNAGVGMSARFLAMAPQDWDWILGINLMGVVHG